MTGDWDGDGITEVGLYTPGTENSNGRWQLRTGAAGLDFAFGDDAPYPVTGDWNGDGRTDVGVFTPATGILLREGRWMLRSSTSAGRADLDFRFGEGTYPVAGDWNGVAPVVTPTPEATPAPLVARRADAGAAGHACPGAEDRDRQRPPDVLLDRPRQPPHDRPA